MQPGSQQRPKALEGVDLAEPVAVLVPGVFASTMTDGLVAVAETRKPGVDAILISMDVRAFGFSMIGWLAGHWPASGSPLGRRARSCRRSVASPSPRCRARGRPSVCCAGLRVLWPAPQQF